MLDDWVNKWHTNLNMFLVVCEKIRSLSSKQSMMNFWNKLNTKIAFLCRFWTQTVTWKPNHKSLTSSFKAILKATIDTIFLGPSLGGAEFFFFILLGGFYNQREYSGANWLVLLILNTQSRNPLFLYLHLA